MINADTLPPAIGSALDSGRKTVDETREQFEAIVKQIDDVVRPRVEARIAEVQAAPANLGKAVNDLPGTLEKVLADARAQIEAIPSQLAAVPSQLAAIPSQLAAVPSQVEKAVNDARTQIAGMAPATKADLAAVETRLDELAKKPAARKTPAKKAPAKAAAKPAVKKAPVKKAPAAKA